MGVSEKRHNFHFGVEYPFNVKYVFCSVSIEIGSGTSKNLPDRRKNYCWVLTFLKYLTWFYKDNSPQIKILSPFTHSHIVSNLWLSVWNVEMCQNVVLDHTDHRCIDKNIVQNIFCDIFCDILWLVFHRRSPSSKFFRESCEVFVLLASVFMVECDSIMDCGSTWLSQVIWTCLILVEFIQFALVLPKLNIWVESLSMQVQPVL